ncbi:unnamed protein product [Amoebophrya sp. A25]|nr:unnamed protein product [Amoebophrya sp. A25]|eukprot:GSA25T00025048001.1
MASKTSSGDGGGVKVNEEENPEETLLLEANPNAGSETPPNITGDTGGGSVEVAAASARATRISSRAAPPVLPDWRRYSVFREALQKGGELLPRNDDLRFPFFPIFAMKEVLLRCGGYCEKRGFSHPHSVAYTFLQLRTWDDLPVGTQVDRRTWDRNVVSCDASIISDDSNGVRLFTRTHNQRPILPQEIRGWHQGGSFRAWRGLWPLVLLRHCPRHGLRCQQGAIPGLLPEVNEMFTPPVCQKFKHFTAFPQDGHHVAEWDIFFVKSGNKRRQRLANRLGIGCHATLLETKMRLMQEFAGTIPSPNDQRLEFVTMDDKKTDRQEKPGPPDRFRPFDVVRTPIMWDITSALSLGELRVSPWSHKLIVHEVEQTPFSYLPSSRSSPIKPAAPQSDGRRLQGLANLRSAIQKVGHQQETTSSAASESALQSSRGPEQTARLQEQQEQLDLEQKKRSSGEVITKNSNISAASGATLGPPAEKLLLPADAAPAVPGPPTATPGTGGAVIELDSD